MSRHTANGPGIDQRGSLPGVVIAYTTADDQYAKVRLDAILHARDHGCGVILYSADAASTLSEPMPNQWGSEGEGSGLSDRLSPQDLEFLGRGELAIQVREAEAGGVTAFGWLPKDRGPKALIEYAIAQGAHRVFVPIDLESIDALARPGMEIERVQID
jgi:hypothetical protein